MMPSTEVTPPAGGEATKALVAELRAWGAESEAGWDAAVGAAPAADNCDVWETLPVIDSKAVARTSPIFEKHLGRKLNIKLIRPGGYKDKEDMIRDLVPRMLRGDTSRRGSS